MNTMSSFHVCYPLLLTMNAKEES